MDDDDDEQGVLDLGRGVVVWGSLFGVTWAVTFANFGGRPRFRGTVTRAGEINCADPCAGGVGGSRAGAVAID